ncbi:MAG: hypothetical protein GXP62_16215, partial [Oligoflexia bacterium]|nr:hypothetical protein [Oligoflexia bacterium]
DGDGYDDMLVGDPGNGAAGDWAGAAYLVLGSVAPASVGLADADAEYTGEAADDFAGSAVSGAGDVNGDGTADLLVGSWGGLRLSPAEPGSVAVAQVCT